MSFKVGDVIWSLDIDSDVNDARFDKPHLIVDATDTHFKILFLVNGHAVWLAFDTLDELVENGLIRRDA